MAALVQWSQIRLLAKPNRKDVLFEILAQPGRINWPTEPAAVLEVRSQVRRALEPSGKDFLDLALLGSLLLRQDGALTADSSWWQEHFGRSGSLAGVSWEKWLRASWVAVPVAVVHDGGSRLQYFMVGHGDFEAQAAPFPGWVRSHLGDDSQLAVRDAFLAAKTLAPQAKTLIAWPLCQPGSGAVTGRSMGLPLALAALSAATGQSLSRHLLATGDIRPDGEVLPVGEAENALSRKADCALQAGYRLFLLPAQNLPIPHLPEIMEVKAVADLAQAWLWACLYHPGQIKQLSELEVALRSGEGFVNNCGSLPPDLLEWCLRERSDRVAEILSEICSDGVLRDGLVNQLNRAVRGKPSNPDRAEVLAALIPEQKLQEANFSPLAAYRWCRLNARVASGSGRRTAARNWKSLSQQWEDDAKQEDMKEFVSFITQDVVIDCHDFYTFRPKLPKDFSETLERQRQVHQLQGGVDYILGGLCGTVAQNYGFCGPRYLANTRAFVAEAQAAFGDGRIHTYRADWRRQFNYLGYALMDAGRLDEAEIVLFQYLFPQDQSDHSARVPSRGERMVIVAGHLFGTFKQAAPQQLSKDDRFMMAAAVRYLAEACTAIPESDWSEQLTSDLREALSGFPAVYPVSHPWQLFLYNLGRVAHRLGDTDLALHYWQTSAQSCGKLGETGAPMALLPIAALDETRGLTEEFQDQARQALDMIEHSESLHREHFKVLLIAGDLKRTLNALRKHRHKLFPFSYR